jgi:hypothetical protein
MDKPMKLEDKILSGYAYQIKPVDGPALPGERKVNLMTGRDGVLLYIEAGRKAGISEEFMAEQIICHTDMGPYPMSALIITKKENNDQGKEGREDTGEAAG